MAKENSNQIHPTAVIGPEVSLGSGNIVGPHCVLIGPLEVGDDNWFGPGVVIGTPPEVRSAPHISTWDNASDSNPTVIGSRNVIREGVSVQQGYYGHTSIGDDCFIMSRAYIAHDCSISDSVTISANVSLAGHCVVQPKANLGLASTFHQFSVIGTGAMVGMGAIVTKPIPPFSKAYGVPARIQAANTRGMQINGFDDSQITLWEQQLLQNTFADRSHELLLSELDLWEASVSSNKR